MNKKNCLCELCHKEIHEEEARFYFPVLPPNHPLADIKGVVHISCLKSIDSSRRIGESLAGIIEGLAKRSESAPLIIRDKNIVLRNRLDENRIEILDFEDFCEISFPIANLEQVMSITPGSSIDLGMQLFRILENGLITIKFKFSPFIVELPALSLDRLQHLILHVTRSPDIQHPG